MGDKVRSPSPVDKSPPSPKTQLPDGVPGWQRVAPDGTKHKRRASGGSKTVSPTRSKPRTSQAYDFVSKPPKASKSSSHQKRGDTSTTPNGTSTAEIPEKGVDYHKQWTAHEVPVTAVKGILKNPLKGPFKKFKP